MDETIAQAGKQDEFLAAQEKLQEGKKLQKAEKAKQILETAKTGTKEALKTASNFFKGKYGW